MEEEEEEEKKRPMQDRYLNLVERLHPRLVLRMTTLRNRVKVRGGNNGSILGNRFCPSMMGPASSLLHKATEGNVSSCITVDRYLPTYLPEQPKIGSRPTVCKIFFSPPSKQIMTLFFPTGDIQHSSPGRE